MTCVQKSISKLSPLLKTNLMPMDLVFSTSVKTTGTHCDRKEAVLVTRTV